MSELPKGWVKIAIGEISDQINGKAFKSKDWLTSGIPIIRIQNLNKKSSEFNYTSINVEEKYKVENGDLLFAWSGTPGTSFGAHIWKGGSAALNQHIFNIRIKQPIITIPYYYYALKITVEEFILNAQGTAGLAHITKKKFDSTEIPLPPLAEQERIVEKLDALFASLDVIKNKLDRIPELLKNFHQRVLTQAVTGKLTQIKVRNEKLGDLLSDIKYGTSQKSVYDLDGIPILRIPNLKNGRIDDEDLKFSNLEPKEFEKLRLKVGDILIIRSNGSVPLVGQSAIIEEDQKDYCYAGYLVRLRAGEKLNPIYLNYALKSSKLRYQIENTARSTSGVNNINTQEIKSLEIPICSVEEQQEIVRRVAELFAIADRVEAQYASLKEKVDQLPQAILTKAFRGELVEQNEGDEPAEVLLGRIMSESRIGMMTRKTQI